LDGTASTDRDRRRVAVSEARSVDGEAAGSLAPNSYWLEYWGRVGYWLGNKMVVDRVGLARQSA
jgi:hypothetical protein